MSHRSIAFILLGLVALLACEPGSFFGSATPTTPPDLIATEVVRQRAVAATLTAEAPPPTQVPPATQAPPAPPTLTLAPLPTATAIIPTAAPTPANKIRALDGSSQGSQRMNVIIQYYYNGEWGTDKIYISATGWNDKAQIMEIYSDRQPVTLGDGVAQLDIVLHDKGTYITSQIQICMFAEGSVPKFICQFWPYPKTWKM